jgi:hypothetical protein
MIRKFRLSFLLPILLVLAQQGAILHELGHLRSVATVAAPKGQFNAEDQDQLPGKPCEKCLVYTQLAGAVTPHVPEFVSPVLTYDFNLQAELAQRFTDVPSARSRGPPIFL